jgi:hypothetical protein
VAASLRPMVGAGGSTLASALGRAAEAARDAIGRGAASAALDEFIALIGHAAEALSAAQNSDETSLAGRLESVASGLGSLSAPPEVPAGGEPARSTRKLGDARSAAHAPPAAPAAPAEAGARDGAPAAPELRVPAPRHSAVPHVGGPDAVIPTLPAPAASRIPADAHGIALAFLTLEQLVAERGMPAGSIDDLLEPGVAGRSTAPRAMAAVPIEEIADMTETVVPMEALIYRGERALRRALELRQEVDALAAAAQNGDPRLTTLLREVFDLVELGLDTSR